MTLAGNALLILTTVVSFLLIPLAAASHKTLAPDRWGDAMGMAFVLFFRWLLFSGAISICAADGAFGRQNRGLIAVALICCAAAMEFLALPFAASAGRVVGLSQTAGNAAVLIAVSLPLPLVVYGWWWLNLRHAQAMGARPWIALSITAAIALAGIAIQAGGAKIQAQRDADPEVRAALFAALGPTSSVGDYLDFSGPAEAGPLRARAMAELAQRPDLIHSIAASIGDENVRAVYKYLHYLAGMQSAPADQLRQPYLDFVEHLRFRIALGDFDAAFLSRVVADTVATAKLLGLHDEETQSALRALADSLRRRPDANVRDAAAPLDALLASAR
jgi:hypothetical protein